MHGRSPPPLAGGGDSDESREERGALVVVAGSKTPDRATAKRGKRSRVRSRTNTGARETGKAGTGAGVNSASLSRS
jgi:hypothetical protein